MLKRTFLAFALAFAATVSYSQTPEEQSETFSRRYDIVSSKLGPAGVGIETILNDWEKVDSLNVKMMTARFNYYLTKSQTQSVVMKGTRKYLGMEPLLQLKDSTGKDVYYFQETFYDDSLFSMAMKSVEKIIWNYPERLDMRFLKAAALISYEKESPDMALACLIDIIDRDDAGKTSWTYPGVDISEDFFHSAIQEYCYTFFSIGSMSSYEAFRTLTEKMLSLYPKNPVYLANMGSYHFVVTKDYKKAVKYYNQVLKIKPDDYTAIKNMILLARKQRNVKLEKKYLPLMVKYGPEDESKAAAVRLEALGKK